MNFMSAVTPTTATFNLVQRSMPWLREKRSVAQRAIWTDLAVLAGFIQILSAVAHPQAELQAATLAMGIAWGLLTTVITVCLVRNIARLHDRAARLIASFRLNGLLIVRPGRDAQPRQAAHLMIAAPVTGDCDPARPLRLRP